MTDTNWTLEIVKLVPTTILGMIAVYIAWSQWKTAHQKVVLDLFDRRFKAYEAIIEAIKPVIREAQADSSDLKALHEAKSGASFLFGEDINTRLNSLVKDIATMLRARKAIEKPSVSPEERAKWGNAETDALSRVFLFQDDFTALCKPYMLMDQMLVPAAGSVLHEWRQRSRKHLSRVNVWRRLAVRNVSRTARRYTSRYKTRHNPEQEHQGRL